MYVSVGSVVLVVAADSPFGLWHNLLGDRPPISRRHKPGYLRLPFP